MVFTCPQLQTYKLAYIQEAIKQGYTFEEIGRDIGISASGIGKCLEKINGNKTKLIDLLRYTYKYTDPLQG